MFSSKNCLTKVLQNKIGFYAKEPYSLPLKPHVDILGLASRGCVEYSMYSWQNFCWYSEYYEDGEDYGDYDDVEEWGLVDYIDCLWLRWSHCAFLLSAVLSGYDNVTRHFIMWPLQCKLCNKFFFLTFCNGTFRCVVNLILGLTNKHRGVWKLSSGPHRSGIKADVDLVTWP